MSRSDFIAHVQAAHDKADNDRDRMVLGLGIHMQSSALDYLQPYFTKALTNTSGGNINSPERVKLRADILDACAIACANLTLSVCRTIVGEGAAEGKTTHQTVDALMALQAGQIMGYCYSCSVAEQQGNVDFQFSERRDANGNPVKDDFDFRTMMKGGE